MNAMKKAHQIRKAAAVKWNCEVSEIHFGECLRLAHKKEDIEMEKTIEIRTTTGKKAIIERINLTEIAVTVPEADYRWQGVPLPGDTKRGCCLTAGRVALTEETVNRIREELSVAPYEIGDQLVCGHDGQPVGSMTDF